MEGWWKGTVIGYDASMTDALVFYDERTLGVPREADYYRADLLNKRYATEWKMLYPN